ncbi:MAG: response regulator [Fibrobacter sp.]|nr:response regulator [Fibrobacter sp.]
MNDSVLIIEDELLIAELVKMNLRMRHITCNVATTGQEGMEMFENQNPSIVLLDVRLPDTDGWELCKKIKQNKPDSVVIFMTAATQKKDREEAEKAGADDFIEKPFDIGELVSLVNKYRKY